MALRQILITVLVLLSLSRLDRRRAKVVARNFAVRLCRWPLVGFSRPYALATGPCVVFAPHPDDESLGCGALIARKRNEGLPVHVVFITDGGASHPGHPNFSREKIIALRRREALSALAILGVESGASHFLNEPDGTLHHLAPEREAALVVRIAALLEEIRPTEIFLPCCPDGSSEHDAAFAFVCRAVVATPLRPQIWQFPVWSWWNPMLLIERIANRQRRCVQPNEDFQAIKLRALQEYRSQTEPLAPWSEPALPSELVKVFQSDAEIFFACEPLASPDLAPRPVI